MTLYCYVNLEGKKYAQGKQLIETCDDSMSNYITQLSTVLFTL